MSELPKGWIEVTVGDVAESMLGKMLDKAKRVTGTMHPYLRNQNVRWDAVDLTDVYEMPFDDDEHSRFGLVQGDLLICEGGEPGRAAVWDGSRPGMKFQKAIHRVRPSPALHPRLLLHRLQADANSGGLDEYFTGTTIKHFTGVSLERYRIPLPPINEQRRIVEKLDAVFEKSRAAKARLERLPALLEKLKRSILAAGFRGDLTKDWRAAHPDVEPASVLLERIRAERRRRWEERLRAKGKDPRKATYEEPAPVDVEGLSELPTGWAWGTLAFLADIQSGVTKGQKRKAGEVLRAVPYLRVANVQRGHLDLDEILEIEATPQEIEQLALKAGDMLLNEGGDRDKLGRGWVWEGQLPLCIHQNHVFRARLYDASVDPRLVSTYANAFGTPWFVDEGKQTTNLASISKTKLSRFPVPVPPALEQKALALRVFELLAAVDAVAARVNVVQTRFVQAEKAAMAAAFRGELVPQDPNDEPASLLLERIRALRAGEFEAKPRRKKATKVARTPQEMETEMVSRPDGSEPYLTRILTAQGRLSAEALWKASQLVIDDFYAQLKDEEERGLLKETFDGETRLLEAA